MQLIDEENIVTYVDFDCGITFYPATPTKIRQISRKRNCISRSCEKPKCIPGYDQHNCFIDKQHNLNVFLNPYNFWSMVTAALTSLNPLMIDTVCPISTLNQQLTNIQQTHIRCSLHYKRWTVKGKDCASTLHSFKKITYQTRQVNETVATVEQLNVGANDGNPPFVMNCNCIKV